MSQSIFYPQHCEHLTRVFTHPAMDLESSLTSLKEQYPALLLTSVSLIRAMIGSDIPGDSHIRDQNTNGSLSLR